VAFTAISGCLQAQSITSKIYFPGLIGLNFSLPQKNIQYKNAIILNTGAEYRPKEGCAFFYRFNYDGVSAKYKEDVAGMGLGNVINGTVQHTYFVLGTGYRIKHGHMGYTLLFQPGLGIHNFDKVSGDANGYTVSQVSAHKFTIKYSSGLEYYLAEHFALVFEPAVYQTNFKSGNSLNSSQIALNIGFTTTLF
jgi:hypothetical protein